MSTAAGVKANGKSEGKARLTTPASFEKSKVGDFRWTGSCTP